MGVVGRNKIVPRDARAHAEKNDRHAVGNIITYWRRLGQAVAIASTLTNCRGVDVRAKARVVRYDSYEDKKLIKKGHGDKDEEDDYLFLHPYDNDMMKRGNSGPDSERAFYQTSAASAGRFDMHDAAAKRGTDHANVVTAASASYHHRGATHDNNNNTNRSSHTTGGKQTRRGGPSPRDVLDFHEQNYHYSQRSCSSSTSTAGYAYDDDFLLPTHRVHPNSRLTPVREDPVLAEKDDEDDDARDNVQKSAEEDVTTHITATEAAAAAAAAANTHTSDDNDDNDEPIDTSVLSRGASPTPPFSGNHAADIVSDGTHASTKAAAAGAKSAKRDAHILSRMKMNMNRLADVLVTKKCSAISVGKHTMRLREVVSLPEKGSSRDDESDGGDHDEHSTTHVVEVYRCRSDPENFNIALKSVTLRDDTVGGAQSPTQSKRRTNVAWTHNSKIANIVRVFNEIEMLEELKYEKNAVHLVSSALRAEAIDRGVFDDIRDVHAMEADCSNKMSNATGSISVLMMMEWCGGGNLNDLLAKLQQQHVRTLNTESQGGTPCSSARAFDHIRPEHLPEQVIVNIARALCNPLIKMHTRNPKPASHRNSPHR